MTAMIIFVYIQLVFYCSAHTSQCKATSVSCSNKWLPAMDFKLPYLALDVCNAGVTNGSFMSQKFECDSQDNLYEKRWIGPDCSGDPYYEEILDDEFEPSLIGPPFMGGINEWNYTRNLNESECSGTRDCDYAILRVYEDCGDDFPMNRGDDYLEQAWVMNECVSSSDGMWSCNFVCNTTDRGSAIYLKCYIGENCDIHSKSFCHTLVVSDNFRQKDYITNMTYMYDIQCDAYIAPAITTTTMTMPTNTTITNIDTQPVEDQV